MDVLFSSLCSIWQCLARRLSNIIYNYNYNTNMVCDGEHDEHNGFGYKLAPFQRDLVDIEARTIVQSFIFLVAEQIQFHSNHCTELPDDCHCNVKMPKFWRKNNQDCLFCPKFPMFSLKKTGGSIYDIFFIFTKGNGI